MCVDAATIERKDWNRLLLAKWLATWGALVGTIAGALVSYLGDAWTGTMIWAIAVVVPIMQSWTFVRKYPADLLGRAVRRFALVQFAYLIAANVFYNFVQYAGWSKVGLQTLVLGALAACLVYALTAQFVLKRIPAAKAAPPEKPESPEILAKKQKIGAILFAASSALPLWLAISYTRTLVGAVDAGATGHTIALCVQLWLLFLGSVVSALILSRASRKNSAGADRKI